MIIKEEKTDTVFVMQKSPWGAVLRSAVIPGWGQLYNESYWKIPVVWGVAGWFAYNWIDQNDKYNLNRNLELSTEDPILKQRYLSKRDFYRDQRDYFAIYLTLTYLLNLVDAYVDAHLFDFTVSEDFLTRTPQLNIRLNF